MHLVKIKPGIFRRSFACFDIQHILVYYYFDFFENRPVNSVRVEKKQIV